MGVQVPAETKVSVNMWVWLSSRVRSGRMACECRCLQRSGRGSGPVSAGACRAGRDWWACECRGLRVPEEGIVCVSAGIYRCKEAVGL